MDHTVDEETITTLTHHPKPEEIETILFDDAIITQDDSPQTDPGPLYSDTTKVQMYSDTTKACCVCCVDNPIVGIVENDSIRDAQLVDIYPCQFDNEIIPDGIMFLSSCGKHYLCIDCMRSIINNYENHPINETNSHFSCPSPFEECVTSIGFKNVFDHNQIQKVCRTTQEWENYFSYAQQYAFPGYTIIPCPFNIPLRNNVLCNTPVFIENEELRQRAIGDLVVECSQNEACLKKFCYYCRKALSYYDEQCNDCKLRYENENPNVLNYYFNKHSVPIATVNQPNTDKFANSLHFDETDYLYYNKDITVPFAVDYISKTIQSHHTHIICPVCKIGLYKTERCNGLSHHGIERCYACGRIGLKVKGLGSHWNAAGNDGCYRFDNESFVQTYVPNYRCQDSLCSDHDKGDCQEPDHQPGIQRLEYIRKKAYVYHLLKSLLPDIKYQVYDELFDDHVNDDEFIEYLPYKQTLVLLDHFKEYSRDYYEDIVYNQLNCHFPGTLQSFKTKKIIIEASDYIISYASHAPAPVYQRDIDISAWRTFIERHDLNWITRSEPDTTSALVVRTLTHQELQSQNSSDSEDSFDLELNVNHLNSRVEDYNYTLLPPINVTTDQQWDEYWSTPDNTQM